MKLRHLMMSACCALSFSTTAHANFIDEGKIVVGSDMTFFPYEYMKNNQPAGFDIEFMNGVARTLNRSVENHDIRWTNLIPGLQGGHFDIINSSMYITAERLKVVDMIPYLKSGESILALKNSAYQPKDMPDFCGHTIATMTGTSWLEQLKAASSKCVSEGKGAITIREYTTNPQATQAVLSHAVEAQMTDAAVACGVIDKLGDRIAITSDKLLYPVLNGICIKKGNAEAKTAIEKGIKAFSKTDEYQNLLKKYHFIAATPEDIKTLMPKA